jgi:hypothetical protein
MEVVFKRTGARRYAVIINVPGRAPQGMNPAPGYDDHIPHDLVHYLVEAELGLDAGVFGRAARGGGTFIASADHSLTTRERARQRRKQERLEASLDAGEPNKRQMLSSERLAALCDVHWRRRHGQRPDPARSFKEEPLSPDDAARVARVVDRLDRVAPLWKALPVDGELVFTWPSAEPSRAP